MQNAEFGFWFMYLQFVKAVPEGGWLDTQFTTYGWKDDPSTAVLLGPQFSQILYSHSPPEVRVVPIYEATARVRSSLSTQITKLY